MSLLIKQLLPFLPDKYIFPNISPTQPSAPEPTIIIINPPAPTPVVTEEVVKPFITGATLRKIVLNLSIDRANEIADSLNKALPKYGLNNNDMFHEFIAQIAHESGGFRYKTENLNYSESGLLKVFGKYFNATTAKQYARNPEKIANRVYANRMGNGSEASGDGWANRGGGYIQLTGKAIWEAYAKFKGLSISAIQTLVRTTEEYAIDSACWYFSIYASLNDEAERDEFLTITKRINGGTNGYQDRVDYLNRAVKYII